MFFQRTTVFLLIAAIFLSLLLIFFQMFQNSMIQSLSQQYLEFVEQVDTISGTLMEIINNTAMQMFYSRSLRMLRTSSELTNAERTAGLRDLGQWVSGSTFLSSALVYNAITDVSYSSVGLQTTNVSTNFEDQATANLLITRPKHGSRGPIKRQTTEGAVYSFLFFESSAPKGGVLLLNVRSEWYERQLLGIASGQNSVILDNLGEILVVGSDLMASKVADSWPTLLQRFEQDGSHGFVLERSGKSGWMYYKLSSLGFYYLRWFDTETILPGLTRTRNFTITLLILVFSLLLVGLIFTLFVLYLPIRTFRETFQKLGRTEEGMLKHVDRLLESQLEQWATQQMERLLRGEDIDTFCYPASLIISDSCEYETIKQTIARYTAYQVLAAQTSVGTAILISEATEMNTLELCLSLAANANGRFLYGHPRYSASEIAQCHKNLLDLWQLRFLHVGQQVLSEKLGATYQSQVDFQTSDAEPLFSSLRAGHLDDARTIWKAIFDRIRSGKFPDFRFYARFIIKNLIVMQKDLGLEPLPGALDIVDNLEDVAQLHQALDGVFIQITSVQDHRRKNTLMQLAERVDERITAGYADDTLSAQRIADEIGMNVVYLGRLYRESTEMSIGEAIKRARIERAKQLLSTSSEPVKDIAAKVGFTNTKYFFVVFKELVGMTPKEFQNRHF